MTVTIDNIVCPCNGGWNSILPAPPCTIHTTAHNGLCNCRGPFDLHPFHSPMPFAGHLTTTATKFVIDDGYVGKHRKPE